jgi:hypothetical protein
VIKRRKIVYLDLFEDGHHYEHALHLLNYYYSTLKDNNFELNICVTDNLWRRLNETIFIEQENVNFIPLNRVQKKLLQIRNDSNNSRFKLIISNIADIYSIFLIKLKHGQSHFLINVLNNLLIPIFFIRVFLWNVKISGIYFNPLFRTKYALDEIGILRNEISYKVDYLKLWFLTRIKTVNKIFILGDKSLIRLYNKLYKTNNFKFIGDPFYNHFKITKSIMQTNKKNQHMILCFGSLQSRKGIFIILDAIIIMDKELLSNFYFKFMGIVDKADKIKVREKIEIISKMKRDKHIDFVDAFVDYNELALSIEESDFIYSGYQSYGASSGVLSWAVLFNKPVIAIRKSLISSTASNYLLTFQMKKYGVLELIEVLLEIAQIKNQKQEEKNTKSYLMENSPEAFANVIFTNI